MRIWVMLLGVMPLLFACDKKEQSEVKIPLTASIEVEGDRVQLVLATADSFPQSGYEIYHRESSKGNVQCINLKYVYQRSEIGVTVPTPAKAFIYATAESEQKFQVKYKRNSANVTVRYDGTNYTIESDNSSFIHP